jgi:RNA polymerase sigma-70 factor (ECF subfamily)
MNLDIKLISDCKKGKAEAQDKIYDLYSAALLGISARYASNIEEAEDVLQESFIKIFTKMSKYQFDSVASFSAWMKRIVVNTALTYIRDNRKNKIFDSIDDRIEMQYQEVSSENEQINISQEDILNLIQKLPMGYRLVFNLYVFEKYSHQDIAAELGVSISTSKSQLFKARQMLQKQVLEKVKKNEYSINHTA